VDRDLALLAVGCRFAEGVIAAISAGERLQLLSVATASTTATGPDAGGASALGALLLGGGAAGPAARLAAGRTIHCSPFLRARSIPVALAWLGVLASVLLVVMLPVQIAGFLPGLLAGLMWIPMAVFEVVLAIWLIAKGVAVPLARPAIVGVG